jgi:succinoglycan biosynthesis protein ExoA
MRNEARRIPACLRSILDQDYPADRIEILVYDGGSTDASWAIVEALAADHPSITLLHNPRRTQAAGWNQGIDRARGDLIGIVGAHSELTPDYVSTAVRTLLRTGADMVGGPMRAVAETPTGQAVALATMTPFGVGGAKFHYATVEQDVDTVYMGVCPAEVYRSLRFDEEMVRNQDDELSYRLLDRGGRIVLDPAIRSRYYNRPTIRSLARQYYEYGFWKVRVMQKHPRQVRPRHLIPALFVSSLLSLGLLSLFMGEARLLLALEVLAYVLVNAAASVVAVRASRPELLPRVMLVYGVLHVAYGVGFLVGLVHFARRPLEHRAAAE